MLEVITESGTRYQIRESGSGSEVRRKSGFGLLRRDGEWLHIHHYEKPEVGKSMVFLLEGLGALPFTERTTSPVVSITSK